MDRASSLILLVALSAPMPSPGADFRSSIRTPEDFEALAGPPFRHRWGSPSGRKQVLFLLDPGPKGAIYFIDSKKFRWHFPFLRAQQLFGGSRRRYHEDVFYSANPRFLLGSIESIAKSDEFGYRIWNSEGVCPEKSGRCPARKRLEEAFGFPLEFLPEKGGGSENEVPLHRGEGIGTLRFGRDLPDGGGKRSFILVTERAPEDLSSVAGLVLTRPVSPAAHIIVLAQSLGIPVCFSRDARETFRTLEGRRVLLSVKANGFRVALSNRAPSEPKGFLKRLPSDLHYRKIDSLQEQRGPDFLRFGAKSANLGELVSASIPGIEVPRGLTVPFHFYAAFLRENRLAEKVHALGRDPGKVSSKELEGIRQGIRAGRLSTELTALLKSRWKGFFRGTGVFVRSSSNASDLPGFSGAGLYRTVPNVRTFAALQDAIKEVWASLWNEAAFKARLRRGLSPGSAQMAVLVQVAVEADFAGVLLTRNPFDPADRKTFFVAGDAGLGFGVVRGKKRPEQILFDLETRKAEILNLSEQERTWVFEAEGGVRARPRVGGERVLPDPTVGKLVAVAEKIRSHFGGGEQEIEWLVKDDRLFLVQVRPLN